MNSLLSYQVLELFFIIILLSSWVYHLFPECIDIIYINSNILCIQLDFLVHNYVLLHCCYCQLFQLITAIFLGCVVGFYSVLRGYLVKWFHLWVIWLILGYNCMYIYSIMVLFFKVINRLSWVFCISFGPKLYEYYLMAFWHIIGFSCIMLGSSLNNYVLQFIVGNQVYHLVHHVCYWVIIRHNVLQYIIGLCKVRVLYYVYHQVPQDIVGFHSM